MLESKQSILVSAAVLLWSSRAAAAGPAPRRVDFNRDVRPILSENCFACHGPDAARRKADLRLDTKAGAFAEHDGKKVLVPGEPGVSELFLRITAADESKRMPPEKSGKHLTPAQVETLRRWIAEGAEWKGHWAYLRIERPETPSVDDPSFVRNDIDRFVLDSMRERGLKPSPWADRATLARRLSFDLLGLPPPLDVVREFAADTSPDACERMVDRLLDSPHHGERLAMQWLDLVRYADTNGYHADNHRSIHPYRDYVIDAFNSNMPFDRFTREQLAGDLLKDSTLEQKVASGYNRLNMITTEGGAQAGEYLGKYAADRVRNASTVWLASTMGCAECHNHKFDPFTQRDFYSFAAFFSDLKQVGVYDGGKLELQPELELNKPEVDAALKPLREQIAEEEAKVQAEEAHLKAENAKDSETLKALNEKLKSLKKSADDLRGRSTVTTLVAMSVEPLLTRVRPRGNWMDDSGEVVAAAVPQFLPGAQALAAGRRANRADLADWILARENPLTARVLVNRLWRLFFGRGIVATLDDFGIQGARPTHPDLLDWLAAELIESGWDVRRMVRLMVTSGAYRQSSFVTRELREADPDNLWIARQGRFRLDAEVVRDSALRAAGLLSEQIGGRSVRPYQPEGYWDHCNIFMGKLVYVQDHGKDLYRRSMYTYWKRTFLHPLLAAFDAPSREECAVDRARSNTPLQALVLLNEPGFVEAARVLAADVLRSPAETAEARIRLAFERVLSRQPAPAEVAILSELHAKHHSEYAADEGAARELLKVGEKEAPDDLSAADLAAWTSVIRTLLNLHEAITRY